MLLLTRVPAVALLPMLGQGTQKKTGVLPAPRLCFTTCREKTGQTLTPPAVALLQWDSVDIRKKPEERYTVANAKREYIPIYLCPCNDRGLEVSLGRQQSFSFILGQIKGR